jgi:general secretion pathway protein D
MTRAVLGIALAFFASISSASVSLDAIPVSAFARLYMTELQEGPYTICDAVLTDSRPISVSFEQASPTVAQVNSALRPYGFAIRQTPSGQMLCKDETSAAEETELVVYRPRHREASFLVESVAPFVKGTLSNRSASLAPSVGADGIQQAPQASSYGAGEVDAVVFRGAPAEAEALRALLAQLDTASVDVVVKAHLVEVTTSRIKGRALDVFLDAISGRVELDVSAATEGASLAIRTGDFTAILSALDSDSRFRSVATPSARVRSGSSVRWVVGQDVPVLGAVQIGDGGVVSQSVEYRQSGTILEVSPVVFEETIAVRVNQSISSAAVTETGVSGSPTILQRTYDGEVTVRDGEVFVIAGLDDEASTNASARVPFLSWPFSKTDRGSTRQLLLLLQVVRA